MILKLQILSLIFSFIFGFSFSLFLKLNDKIIHSKFKIIKYIGSFLIVLIGTISYFLGLQKINNSNFHLYLLIMIIIGYVIENIINKKIKRIIVKLYKK